MFGGWFTACVVMFSSSKSKFDKVSPSSEAAVKAAGKSDTASESVNID